MNLPWWAWLLIAWAVIQFPLGVLIGRLLERHEDSEDPKTPAPGGGTSPGPVRHARDLPPRVPAQVPGQDPAQAVDPTSPPGPGTTARVLRFQADLECGCRITHHLPRAAANSMRTAPCPGHGWCALRGWRIGGVGDGRYAYVWETCPAHSQPAVTP